MKDVAITILTCKRSDYLRKTLKGLEQFVFDPETCICRIFVNAVDTDTMQVIDDYKHLFDDVFTSDTNLRQGPALNRLWTLDDAEFILHIEDDMVAERTGWLMPSIDFMRKYSKIGQLRLFPFWNNYAALWHNLVTGKSIEFFEKEAIEKETFSRMISPHHLTFCPSLLRREAAQSVLPLSIDDVRDQAENQAQKRFCQANWDTAQIHEAPFTHIGRESAFGGWGVGFGLHPTTRIGKARLWTQRKIVSILKRILGQANINRCKRLLGMKNKDGNQS